MENEENESASRRLLERIAASQGGIATGGWIVTVLAAGFIVLADVIREQTTRVVLKMR